MRLGILPAGGRASRFRGADKELLPVGGESLLFRSYCTLIDSACTAVIVVTSSNKMYSQALKLGGAAVFMLDHGRGMWSAMRKAMTVEADEYYFLMPDTYIPDIPLPDMSGYFMLGTFESDKPSRFGRFVDGKIIDKHDSTGLCWGTAAWSKDVRDFWREEEPPDYTEAFNLAIAEFGLETFPLDYYYDIASHEDYVQLLNAIA